MENKFKEFIQWGFQALLLAIVSWGVSELSALNNSVQQLNINMAIVVTKSERFERDIVRHDQRIEKLEERK
jgi:hypothetical protein